MGQKLVLSFNSSIVESYNFIYIYIVSYCVFFLMSSIDENTTALRRSNRKRKSTDVVTVQAFPMVTQLREDDSIKTLIESYVTEIKVYIM